jgi:3-methyladenine DNA glycosylase/8-oxoguanine DNA glycosylase
MRERFLPTRERIDLARTFFPLRRGRGDPTMRIGAAEVWKASRTPDGSVTVRLTAEADGVRVHVWGDGAGWVLHRAAAWAGVADRIDGFEPPAGPVRRAWRACPGLRMTATGLVTETLVPTVLEQKVTGSEARLAYRRLALALGEPAPGPEPLTLPPDPARIAALPYHAFHRFGVERRRADVLRIVASRAGWLDGAARMPLADARARLRLLPGIGPWTVAEVSRIAFGDADAVSIGDFHVPHVVAWALAGEPRGSDERMLELLEPYRPHRGRVQLLLEASGVRPPAYGPRMQARAIERL